MRQPFSRRIGTLGAIALLGVGGMGLFPSCIPRAPRITSGVAPTPSTMLVLVNQARAAAGVAPLTEVSALDSAALTQSFNQASAQTMSHNGPDGSNAGQRIANAGYSWSAWGENVAAGQVGPTAVMAAWMNSPPHKANILSPAFTGMGIASLVGANGVTYWTMELAKPG